MANQSVEVLRILSVEILVVKKCCGKPKCGGYAL